MYLGKYDNEFDKAKLDMANPWDMEELTDDFFSPINEEDWGECSDDMYEC